MTDRPGTILFFDLAAFSEKHDPEQSETATAFFNRLRELLTDFWGQSPERKSESPYFILPTGDGAAIVIWEGAKGFSRQESSIWLAVQMFAWAELEVGTGLRSGINDGVVDLINDPYGIPNVCGTSINMAQRIMDAAAPCQLLVHHDEFTKRIFKKGTIEKIQYELVDEIHEILGKHNVLIKVNNILGKLELASLIFNFGTSVSPAEKWHLQIEPAIVRVDEHGKLRLKKPPQELLEKHKRIAFVGATNDQLADAIKQVTDKKWEILELFFLRDQSLKLIETPDRNYEQMIKDKQRALSELSQLLKGKAERIQFYEYKDPFYFASYWDWDAPGGRIHISPYIWGENVRTIPALDYVWRSTQPTAHYQAYREGLENLRRLASEILKI